MSTQRERRNSLRRGIQLNNIMIQNQQMGTVKRGRMMSATDVLTIPPPREYSQTPSPGNIGRVPIPGLHRKSISPV